MIDCHIMLYTYDTLVIHKDFQSANVFSITFNIAISSFILFFSLFLARYHSLSSSSSHPSWLFSCMCVKKCICWLWVNRVRKVGCEFTRKRKQSRSNFHQWKKEEEEESDKNKNVVENYINCVDIGCYTPLIIHVNFHKIVSVISISHMKLLSARMLSTPPTKHFHFIKISFQSCIVHF